VKGADPSLVQTLSGSLQSGRFLDDTSSRYPMVVLGATAAKELGISDTSGNVSVVIGGRRFTVIGILQPLPLASELDRSALVGLPVAHQLFGTDGSPSRIYLRASLEDLGAVRSVLGMTANPESPEEIRVSRPSDALAARAAASTAFTALFLGLGSVALLVGGVGIANVMVISVLERRSEIGLRRALGATRGHIRGQFLAEALLLSGLGGAAGVLLGALVVLGYAYTQGWTPVVPLSGLLGGIVASLLIGGVAGLYPAVRAARLAPAEALRTT
jgi:putative ABC transport system permease protein